MLVTRPEVSPDLCEIAEMPSQTVGRTKLLTANDQNPYFEPLAQVALMAFGPPPVIGTPHRDAVYDAARRSQQRLGREVNVTQRTTMQWETVTDGFSKQLRASPMINVPDPSRHAEMEQGK